MKEVKSEDVGRRESEKKMRREREREKGEPSVSSEHPSSLIHLVLFSTYLPTYLPYPGKGEKDKARKGQGKYQPTNQHMKGRR